MNRRMKLLLFGVSDPLKQLLKDLYGQGEQGAFYVPKPQVLGEQVLFQDAAGTVPVENDGDPVGLMIDISGNSNHASQEVSANRPIYRTEGGKHWIEFDGVNDRLITAIMSFGSGDQLTVSAPIKVFSQASTQCIAETGSHDSSGTFTLRPVRSSSDSRTLFSYRSEPPNPITGNTIALEVASLLSGIAKDGVHEIRQNGLSVGSTSTGTDSLDSHPLVIGAGGETGEVRNFMGHIYGFGLVRKADEPTVKAVEFYFATLTGINLDGE